MRDTNVTVKQAREKKVRKILTQQSHKQRTNSAQDTNVTVKQAKEQVVRKILT